MSEDYSFEMAFYEALERKDPLDLRVLEILAQLYTKVGKNQEGLSMDMRLAKIRPEDPTILYNLACSLSIVGQPERAVETLQQSIKLGYKDYKWMMEDPDLDNIRTHPSYLKLIEEISM